MNRPELVKVGVAIITRWPHPDFTESPEVLDALGEDIGHLDYEEAMAAVRRLVTEGERYQPRGPAIMRTVEALRAEERRLRREAEWEARQAARALEEGEVSEQDRAARAQAARDALALVTRRRP